MRIWPTDECLWNIYLCIVCCLFVILPFVRDVNGEKRSKSKHSEVAENEAIEQLSQVFGIEHSPQHNVRSTPPQFMLELFDDITDAGGLIRKDGPYNASTIVSFPDRANNTELHFYYNVSIHFTNHILESEFHLFRITPKTNDSRLLLQNGRLTHVIEIKVYQILDSDNMYSDQGRILIDKKRLSTHARGWVIFNVTRAVREWAEGKRPNHGLLVISQNLYGEELGENDVRFAQRKAHHDTKQPILVVYTTDGRQRTPHYIPPNDQEYQEITRDSKRLERKYQRKIEYQYNSGLQNVVKFLNEKEREEYGHPFFMRNTRSARSLNTDVESIARRKWNTNLLNRITRTNRTTKRIDKNKRNNRERQTCTRQEMFVDFDEIGWAGWIISPKGYNAYHCKGACPFPLGQSQRPTNHATVQSIVHALRVGKSVSTPCCVPNKLYSISLLYFDDAENVILKQYDDMVAASCGCH